MSLLLHSIFGFVHLSTVLLLGYSPGLSTNFTSVWSDSFIISDSSNDAWSDSVVFTKGINVNENTRSVMKKIRFFFLLFLWENRGKYKKVLRTKIYNGNKISFYVVFLIFNITNRKVFEKFWKCMFLYFSLVILISCSYYHKFTRLKHFFMSLFIIQIILILLETILSFGNRQTRKLWHWKQVISITL